jgi:hypothetical protein
MPPVARPVETVTSWLGTYGPVEQPAGHTRIVGNVHAARVK